jgi:hypothetical protein
VLMSRRLMKVVGSDSHRFLTAGRTAVSEVPAQLSHVVSLLQPYRMTTAAAAAGHPELVEWWWKHWLQPGCALAKTAHEHAVHWTAHRLRLVTGSAFTRHSCAAAYCSMHCQASGCILSHDSYTA